MRMSNAYLPVLLVLVLALVLIAGYYLPLMNCQDAGRLTHQNYYFHPAQGCFLQDGNGNFYRISGVTNYMPPE